MNWDKETTEEGPGFGGFWRGWGGAGRMNRGDISPIVLHVLKNKPMHGYEIIRYLEEKSHGFWRPSAGSIYPTLQLLEEQGLVRSQETDGKKVYELTDEGQAEAEKPPFRNAPPHFKAHLRRAKRFGVLKETMVGFFQTMKKIGTSGSDEQITKVKEILDKVVVELKKLADEVPETPRN